MNKIGEKKKYFKSQKRSDCNTHFQFGFLDEKEENIKFFLHKVQSAPIFPEAWYIDTTFETDLIQFTPGAVAWNKMQMLSPSLWKSSFHVHSPDRKYHSSDKKTKIKSKTLKGREVR